MVKLIDGPGEQEIIETIRKAESGTSGEIRVHVKRGASRDAMIDARKFFQKAGMHRTRDRNGVLIFISWKSRVFAILGDEAIHRTVGNEFWSEARDKMSAHFSKHELKDGILTGIRAVGEKLTVNFPRRTDDRNELPNTVTEG